MGGYGGYDGSPGGADYGQAAPSDSGVPAASTPGTGTGMSSDWWAAELATHDPSGSSMPGGSDTSVGGTGTQTNVPTGAVAQPSVSQSYTDPRTGLTFATKGIAAELGYGGEIGRVDASQQYLARPDVYTPTDQAQLELMARGFTAGQAAEQLRVQALSTPGTRDELYYETLRTQAWTSSTGKSAAYHTWAQETNLPQVVNPYEYSADLFTYAEKGYPTRSKEAFSPVDYTALGLVGGKGGQAYMWTGEKYDLRGAMDVVARAERTGDLGPYGSLRAYSSVYGELPISTQQAIGALAARGAGESILTTQWLQGPERGAFVPSYGSTIERITPDTFTPSGLPSGVYAVPDTIRVLGKGEGIAAVPGSYSFKETVVSPSQPTLENLAKNTASEIVNTLSFGLVTLPTRAGFETRSLEERYSINLPTPFVSSRPAAYTPSQLTYDVSKTSILREQSVYDVINTGISRAIPQIPIETQFEIQSQKGASGYAFNVAAGGYQAVAERPLDVAKYASLGVILAAGGALVSESAIAASAGTRAAGTVATAVSIAPVVMGGAYAFSVGERSTLGFTQGGTTAASRLGGILSTEALPMFAGGYGYSKIGDNIPSVRGFTSKFEDVTYGIRQRSMGIENIGIGGGAQPPSARYTAPVQTTPLSLTQGTRISPESVLNPEQLVLSEYPSASIMAMEAPTVFTMRTAWYDQPPTKVSTVEGMKFIMERYGRPMQSERGQELVRAYEAKTGREISFVDEMDRYLMQTQMVGKTPEMQRQRITEIPTYDLRPVYATPREPFSLRTEAEMRPTFNLITGEVISARGIPVMTAAERSMVITQYGLTPREVTEARVRGLTLEEILSQRNVAAVLSTGATTASVGFVRQGMIGVSEKAMLPLGGMRTQDITPEYSILGLTRPSMVGAGEYPMYDVVSIPKERTVVAPFAIPAEAPSRRTTTILIPQFDIFTRPDATSIPKSGTPWRPETPGTPPPPPPGITTPKIPLLPLPFSGSGGAWGGGPKWRRSFLETFRMGLDISSQYRMPKSITSYKRRK